METKEVKPTPKKTTRKTSTTKSTTSKTKSTQTETKSTQTETKSNQTETKPNDALAALSSLSPEMIAQLVALVQNQNVPVEKVEPNPSVSSQPKRLNKAYLNTIRDEEVEVRNLTSGMVAFTSQKTGATYKWMGRDEVEIMTVGEVVSMHSQSEKFLKTPWLIVDNEDVMVSLGLADVKKQVEEFDDLDEILNLPAHKIKEKLSELSPSYLAQIGETVGVKILNGELRDIYVIRELEDFFGRKFLI